MLYPQKYKKDTEEAECCCAWPAKQAEPFGFALNFEFHPLGTKGGKQAPA
jgi:hypothetical protein